MKTIQEQWRDYRDLCYPKGIKSADQNKQLHAAFVAGVISMLQSCLALAEFDEDTAELELTKLHAEALEIARAHAQNRPT